MQRLIAELTRLYLPPGAMAPGLVEQHVLGASTQGISLVNNAGLTRALVIPFRRSANADEAQHWHRLCAVANALQRELGLPAPAVSISGADGYGLWLSLETPMPVSRAQDFLELLCKAYCPDLEADPDGDEALIELPPCLHRSTGKWAAFINPGLGASFADDPGLEMAPPFAGQAALLDGVQSITEAQFQHALTQLHQTHDAVAMLNGPVTPRAPATAGLLLKDASLEDIVRHLHAKNIEPTFRHFIGKE